MESPVTGSLGGSCSGENRLPDWVLVGWRYLRVEGDCLDMASPLDSRFRGKPR
jgi:hypothetical protein